jgi:hypothetical protein
LNFHLFRTGLFAAIMIAALVGCTDPPAPPEVQQALQQEQDLWQAGASVYAPAEHQAYINALQSGRERLAKEQARFPWFRDDAAVAAAFRDVLAQGQQVLDTAKRNREQEASEAADCIGRLERKLEALRGLDEIKDRRVSRRSLVPAEIGLDEARRLTLAGKSSEAQRKAAEGEAEVARVCQSVRPLVARYAEPQQIASWRQVADDVIAESRRTGGDAIVVRKLDRELVLYHAGRPIRTYEAGLGFNYLADKLYSGDQATPEGRYRVIKKLHASRYYRALLIDYPNAEDYRRFQKARQEGRIPRGAGIGGLIEIHGGGTDGMTTGCIALENPQMLELFERIAVGTPVAIVGTLENQNLITQLLPWLK